jgi:hypothetical protein
LLFSDITSLKFVVRPKDYKRQVDFYPPISTMDNFLASSSVVVAPEMTINKEKLVSCLMPLFTGVA